MDIIDIALFIFYSIFFYIISSKNKNNYNKRIYTIAFGVKIIGSILASYLTYYVNPESSDSFVLYFTKGTMFYNLILKDIDNIKYLYASPESTIFENLNGTNELLQSKANFLIVKIVTIISFLCFGKYFTLGLFFSFFSLTGLWKLFQFFSKLISKYSNYFFVIILITPNIVIWSCGMLKDPICIGALGWLTYLGHEIFIEKKYKLIKILLLLTFTYTIFIVKFYIILAYLPPFVYFLIIEQIKIKPIKLSIVLTTVILVVSMFTIIVYQYGDVFEKYAFATLLENLQEQQGNMAMAEGGSSYSLGIELDGTINSLIKIAPLAFVATFFRPFIWESHNLLELFTAIESSIMIFFCIYVLLKVGIHNFFYTAFHNVVVFYSLTFAIIFGIFVGATTLNFGTLVRYKMPCIPFFIISFMLILKSNQKFTTKIKIK